MWNKVIWKNLAITKLIRIPVKKLCILHSENDIHVDIDVNVCVVGWGEFDGGDQWWVRGPPELADHAEWPHPGHCVRRGGATHKPVPRHQPHRAHWVSHHI